MNRREAIKAAAAGAAALAAGGTLAATATATPLPVNDGPFFGGNVRFVGGRLVWRGLDSLPGRELFAIANVLNDAPLYGCPRGAIRFDGPWSHLREDGHELTTQFRRRAFDPRNMHPSPDGKLGILADRVDGLAHEYADIPKLIGEISDQAGHHPELTLEFEPGDSTP